MKHLEAFTRALLDTDGQIALYVTWLTNNRHILLQRNTINQVTQVYKRSKNNEKSKHHEKVLLRSEEGKVAKRCYNPAGTSSPFSRICGIQGPYKCKCQKGCRFERTWDVFATDYDQNITVKGTGVLSQFV